MSKKNKATDETQIRKMIDDWADALRNKNAEGVLSHYTLRPVHFSLAPPLLSAESDAKGLNAWFAAWQGTIGYEIRGLSVTVGDNVALAIVSTGCTERPMARRAISGFDTRSASGGSVANGRSRTSMNRCPSTWTVASKPPWISSREQQ